MSQFNDPTIRFLNQLQPRAAALGFQLINAMREAGIPAYISSGRRSYYEQAKLVLGGHSQTLNSRHVEGRAFDIDILGYSRDQLPKQWWLAVGSYAERLGLRWGGRWASFYDAGHFEV
jgi:peptidoglycan L-alanyl-D-glutamate endopeptidase CwlK